MKALLVILFAGVLMIFLINSFSRFDVDATSSPQARASQNQTIPEIRGYDFSDRKATTLRLSKNLREISGLTFTSGGRLLAHGDERAVIYELDLRTGKEKKYFSVGRLTLMQDFEGIAAKKDTIFLVNSSGVLYRFPEGANGQRVSYREFRTSLDVRYDVEGLVYDPATDCLLLACKEFSGAGRNQHKAVYAFSLRTYRLLPEPRFLLSLKTVTQAAESKEFNPSGIERHPRTGNFFIIAANGNAIVEATPDGKMVGISKLPKPVHKQAEGIAIAPDGTLVIANEGGEKEGCIVIYRPIQRP
jgi:uncharacterized protein YjiK